MSNHDRDDLDGFDPYELLGIPSSATRAEIIAAHREQVLLVHPDRPGGDEYTTKLLHIARAVLLNPEERAKVDAGDSSDSDEPDRDDDPPAGVWDEEELDRDDEPESVWESEEVVSGVHPPVADPPPTTTWQSPIVPPPRHWPPAAPPPPTWQAAPVPVYLKSTSTLPIVAFAMSFFCCLSPVGLVLGVIGVVNPKGRYDRALSIGAIVLGVLGTGALVLWVLVAGAQRVR
ncbi:J domain-containing protein [Actinosynnema sp. NPDC020468]|uniref:J domain-containing protein n=1 Tax=Actinosynnema sp. NPDC020468 TaxID=3154488 RepID=UPI0033C2EC03